MNILLNISLIVLFNLLFFHRTLSYGYVSDDIPVSVHKEPIPKNFLHRIWIQFRGQRYMNARESHWITLTIHILNCVLIYIAFGKNLPSLTAALFFSVNPINTQGGSIWISGKPYSSATLCVLGMYALPYVAPLGYIVASFFSGNALLTPLPFLLTRFWFLALLPALCFGIFYKVISKKWNLKFSTNTEMRAIAWRKFIPYFKTFGYYFRICCFPYKLGLYHTFIWGLGVNKEYNKKCYRINRDFWIGLIIWMASLLHIIFVRDMVSFGLMWFMVNISMFCNFITIQQQIAERFVYLPNVGLMLAMSFLCLKLPPPISYYFLSLILAYFITRLWYYRESYINDYWQVEYNIIEQKDSHYAWFSRGIKKFFHGDFPGALMDFAEARNQEKNDFKQNINMAVMFLALGDFPHCEEHLKYAEETLYDEMEERQREEYIVHTKELLEQAKKTGQIKASDLKVIK